MRCLAQASRIYDLSLHYAETYLMSFMNTYPLIIFFFSSGKYREGDENHLDTQPHYVAIDVEDAINFILREENI